MESTDTITRRRVRRAIETNDPEIKPGQFWVARNESGEIMRRLLILAQYPDDVGLQSVLQYEKRLWIYEEHRGKLFKTDVGRISTCAEFNLRYVFELE